jgi:hypothetical protein
VIALKRAATLFQYPSQLESTKDHFNNPIILTIFVLFGDDNCQYQPVNDFGSTTTF